MSSEEGGEDTRVKMETETITVSVPNDDSASLISQPARPTSMKRLDLEGAKDILAELSLTSVQFGDYLVIMNSDFDMIISEEPYHALTLLIDITSWKYMARIWNSTVNTGTAGSVGEFQDLCRDHFSEKRLCLGLLEEESAAERHSIIISQTPVPRIVSKTCLGTLGKEEDSNVYSCSECVKLMGREEKSVKTELEETVEELAHMTTEASFNKSYKCTVCDKRFGQLGNLKRHIEKFHSGAGPLSNVFNETAESDPLGKKRKYLRGKKKAGGASSKFQCTICKTSYKYASSLQLHMKEFHSVNYTAKVDATANMTNDQVSFLVSQGQISRSEQVCTLIKCPECALEFSWKRTLMEHRKKVHFYGAFKCLECNLTFQYAKDLAEHVFQRQHEEKLVYCPSCCEQINVGVIVAHYRTCVYEERKLELKEGKARRRRKSIPLPKARKCPYCQKLIKSLDSLTVHKKRIHFWGVFRCPKCNQSEHFASDLMKHMLENNHGADPNVKCPSCKENFDIINLGTHYETCIREKMKLIRGGRPRMCQICGKVLANNQTYYYHKKTHLRPGLTEEEAADKKLLFYCDECPKTFGSQNGLKLHVRTIHEGINPPGFCTICNKSFPNVNKLRSHKILVHNTDEKYQCKFCKKRIANTAQLRIHMETHEEPKFKCSFCGKMLKTAENLEYHEREHRGERPFQCQVCGNAFVSEKATAQHMKLVHKVPGPTGKLPSAPKKPRKKKSESASTTAETQTATTTVEVTVTQPMEVIGQPDIVYVQ